MKRLIWMTWGALALGCSFDATGGTGGGTDADSGPGTDTGTDATSDGTTTTTTSATSDSAGTTSSSSSSSSSTTGSTTGSTSGASATDSATGASTSTTDPTTGPGSTGPGSTSGAACEPTPEFSQIYWVADAVLSDGMQQATSQTLPGNPDFAYSEVAETGVVTFEVKVPCDDDYFVWALVWDRYQGTQNPSNADSFFYNADGGTEVTFGYGCGTWQLGDGVWSWQALGALDGSQCPQGALVQPLTAGGHHLNFRNREAGDFQEQNMAAIAAIVVSNDPNHDPATQYQP